MKLLLDTHIWIWLTLEPKRLVGRVARALDNPENDLWLSPISIWELLMLAQKGRIRLDEDAAMWARHSIERLGLREATLTNDVALETATLSLPHSDPSDRMIAASAKVLDLTLVTADEKLMAGSGIKILPNR